MSERAIYLDVGPGEQRGVVTLGGRPERLFLVRRDDAPVQGAGARVAGRVRRVEPALQAAFVDLGSGPDALVGCNPSDPPLREGMFLALEIQAPARREKGPSGRILGPDAGPVRLLAPPPALEDQLLRFAPDQVIIRGAPAREAADIAEDEALAVVHPLPCGGRIHLEPTQALVAVDVDLGEAVSLGRKAAARANAEALEAGARLLRLKGLGGVVAVDLVGRGHNGAALCALAKTVFAPDGPGVAIGPISRFGVLELALPWRGRPISEILLGPDRRLTAQTTALRLLRSIERAAGPGQMVEAVCAPAAAAYATRYAPDLVARIGSRFSIRSDPAREQERFEVIAR